PVKTDGAEEMRAADALVRRALDFLVKLFPATDAHVGYVRKEEAPLLGGSPSSQNGGAGRFEDIREVPGHPEFLRAITISVDERIGQFLGEDAEAHLQAAYARLKVPVILAQGWTRQMPGHAHSGSSETREALRAQLPTHVIAHLIADQFAQVTGQEAYRFARHAEPGSAHDELAGTIVESLDYMNALTRSRVEHQELTHGLIIAPRSEIAPRGERERAPGHATPSAEGRSSAEGASPPALGHYPEDFRDLKRTSLLTDGYQSALCITPAGRAARLVTRDTVANVPELLDRDLGSLSFLAAASKQHNGIGLMLRQGGSITTFAGGRPLFVRRSGVWHGLLWDQIQSTMTGRYGEVGAQVFGVALLLTTSSKGGIIAVSEDPPDALSLHEKDRVDRARSPAAPPQGDHQGGADRAGPERESTPEWFLHRLLPAGNILDLSRPTLALLAGIDGATVVDPEGHLISYGAIVESMQGRSEGARTAAARTLSAHGLVIKVSEDGPVQIFENGEPVLTV
ncbi:MAG: hypothetical protein BRD48_07300, partial [Bacteroidetes bacterium QS_9_68_14]